MQTILRQLPIIFFLWTLTAHSLLVSAAETNISSSLGNNSNPLEVAESFNPSSALYLNTSIKISERIKDWLSLNVGANSLKHEGNMEKADTDNYHAGFKLITWHRYFEQYLTIHSADISYKKTDKTYLDIDGSIASYNGASIGNRYDREAYSFEQRNRIKLNNQNRILLSWFYIDTQYENFSELSNLDNNKYGLSTSWIYSINKTHDYELFAGKDEQAYDNKEDRTSNGEIVADSDLKINSYDYGFKYKLNHNDSLKYWLGLEHAQGKAEESGYYTYKRDTAFTRVEYQLTKKITLDLQLSLSDQQYHEREKNEILVDGEITSLSSRNKLLAYVQRHQVYQRDNLKLAADFFLRARQYNSNLDDYSYKQEEIGISFELTF